MSTTQVSQTLFRFVSVRSPQLTDEAGKDKRFVFRPDVIKNQSALINVFDAAAAQAANGNKWELLNTAATSFKASANYLATENAVEQFAGTDMYKFSTWLARNRDSFTNAELLAKAAEAGALLSTTKATTLWNNLFYQVITQESFYIKEAIMHLLVANHTIANLDTNTESEGLLNNIIHAKAAVVLPRELFLDESSTAGIGGRAAIITPAGKGAKQAAVTTSVKEKLSVINAKYYNQKYSNVKKNVEKLEKEYKKAYEAAYNEAFKIHQEVIKPAIDQYIAERDAAKLKWCAENKATGVQLNADDPCNNPPVIPQPDLPKFVFSFQTETGYLQQRLGADDITLINSLSGTIPEKNTDAEPLPGGNPIAVEKTSEAPALLQANTLNADSFAAIRDSLSRAIDQNNDGIIANTSVDLDSIVIIGGMGFPVSNTTERAGNCENFVATTASFHTDSEWFMRIFFENTGVNIATASYEVYDLSGNLAQADTAISNIDGDYYTIFSGQPLLQITNEISGGFKLKGSFTLTDGDTYYFDITMDRNYAGGIDPLTGLYNLVGTGAMCKNTGTGGGGVGTDNFKPSGFGVKQLGIADYKKVEQTVHCYVEGEVAHIENIMAREYREKSTRRLRRSENTTTTSAESESEHLSDTTSTDRFEMQSEVAKVMQESRDFSANASVSGTVYGVTLSAGANYATHNSKEQSMRTAVTEAKEITQRAMDRVVSRVKQERIEKIIEEFEENNKHGFDNTKGDKHVVGVYRWVDKIYKNQIFNFGKRLMFEFMIPEPAKLHILGMKESQQNAADKVLVKPTDPRKATQMKIATSAALGENEARYWASMYNAEIEPMPEEYIYAAKTFADSKTGDNETFSKTENLEIKEGYKAIYIQTVMQAAWDWDNGQRHSFGLTVGDWYRYTTELRREVFYSDSFAINKVEGQLPISYEVLNYLSFNISVSATLQRTNTLLSQWKQQTFNAIITAYEKALAKYEDDLAQQQAIAGNIKESNPGFYRDIENIVLRKNCISYLIDQTPTARLTYGKQMYKSAGQNAFKDYEVNVTKALDDYSAFVKFLEQAFEWNIMSYYFYPFYWGNRTDWPMLYQYDNNDPVFRSFMQSGMARVVVTVRPGFEDAVRFYMQTGLIWNGGEVPVIDDPLHLSIIDELKAPEGKPEGKAWATRIPTSLTILQADSIGLKVEKALPCNCDDVTVDTWENPAAVPCGDNFLVTQDILNNGAGNANLVQFSFTEMDSSGFTTIHSFDVQKSFPRVYECMGQQISIDRDASWQPSDSSVVIFEKLAQQLSLLPGLKAAQKTARNGNPAGITFTVDGNIVPLFTFMKPAGDENFDSLKVGITADTVRVATGLQYSYKVLDATGKPVIDTEVDKLLPISRFKV